MKVSFLVTYYNQEQYVKQSMDSILAIEKPCDWEILVGDDGSSDGTVAAVREYMDRDPEHIRLFIMPRDIEKKYDSVKRASANRINLLENCTGDCFCTLDGDDFFCDTTFIRESIEVFEEDQTISLVAFGFRYFRNGKFEDDKLLTIGDRLHVDTEYYIRNSYIPAGSCVHRVLWDKERVEYIRRIGYFDDNDIVINSLNYGEMYYINKAIYAYRQTGESTFTSMNTLEQAVLNVQGLDVDTQLILDKYRDSLILRNAYHILTLYIWRKKVPKILGEIKYDSYVNDSGLQNSNLLFLIAKYDNCSNFQKKEIKKIIRKCVKLRWKFAIKQYCLCLVDG